MSADVFQYRHRVTYSECAPGNHVYYARYLDMLEAARGEFLRSLGAPLIQLQETDTVFPVVECHVRYKGPARYDDVLTIEVWPLRVTPVRLNFSHRILNASGKLLVEAETFHVCAGIDEKLKRLPEQLAAQLQSRIPASANAQPAQPAVTRA